MSLLRLRALLSITSEKLDEKEDDDFILFHFRFILGIFLADKPSDELVVLCLKCLINLCSSEHRNQLLFDAFSSNDDRLRFLARTKELLSSEHMSLALGLLCNLTRTSLWLTPYVQEEPTHLISSIFSPDMKLRTKAALIVNLTASKDIRQILCCNSLWVDRLIREFDEETNSEIALLFAGILKNMCFEDDCHKLLLDNSHNLLDVMLIRLCGAEDEIHPDDRKLLPPRVRAVIGTPNATRSDCFKLKTTICQALLQLCATCDSRTHLRSNGVYFVLRELHKYEHSRISSCERSDSDLIAYNELVYYLEQVVDQLICEERERDKEAVETSLRHIDVDEKIREKLDRIKLEAIGTLETEVDA